MTKHFPNRSGEPFICPRVAESLTPSGRKLLESTLKSIGSSGMYDWDPGVDIPFTVQEALREYPGLSEVSEAEL